MNTLSILIYLAGVAGSLNGFIVFVTVIFGVLAAGSLVSYVYYSDETDAWSRPLPEASKAIFKEARAKSWRRMWLFLMLMIVGGVSAAAVPDRQTVLLIAASEMGEQVLNHPRVTEVVDPGIELLTTWMRAETDKLRGAQTSSRSR
jgi:hypothetical protein